MRHGRRKVKKKQANRVASRDAYLRKTYNISLAEYEALAAVYQGGCWICRTLPKPGKNLAVDHDHKLAKSAKSVRVSVRGILCFFCNKRRIGRNRREHAELYRRAASYLESDKAQEVLGCQTSQSK